MKTKKSHTLRCSIFQTPTLQGWKRLKATRFCDNNNLVVFFQFIFMNVITIDSWQRSRHLTYRTLQHRVNSKNERIGMLMTGNDSSYMILKESWAAAALICLIIAYSIDICDEVLAKKSYYNKIQYKCELKMVFCHSLYDTRTASSNNGYNRSVLEL